MQTGRIVRGFVTLALSLLAPAGADSPAPGIDPAAARLAAEVGSPVEVARSRATGAARFVRLASGDRSSDLAPRAGTADERARAFIASHRELFGLADVAAELRLVRESADPAGFRNVAYQQTYRGVPVFAAVLRAHFDGRGRLRAVNGTVVPGLALDVAPRVGAAVAAERAAQLVRGRSNAPASSPAAPELVVYRDNLERDLPGNDYLAWKVTVAGGAASDALVFVDARTGKVVDSLPLAEDALFRVSFPGGDDDLDGIPDAFPASPDWLEGDPLPSGWGPRDDMLLTSGDFYARLLSGFGRDSWNATGAPLGVVHDETRACPDAYARPLFGYVTSCPGLETHDVIAHEWTHFLTSATSELVYRWQSGALNESFSDVMGEAFDQRTTLASPVGDTDDPAFVRSPGACSTATNFATSFEITGPVSIAGTYPNHFGWYGPRVSSSIAAPLVFAHDGSGVDPDDACEPLTNGAELVGAVVFANRGNCPDYWKTLHAQAAGAAALVTGNVATSPNPETWVAPWCGDPLDLECQHAEYTIPSLGLPLSAADRVRSAASRPITVVLSPKSAPGSEPSVRWLIGEDVAVFPGFRDLWSPHCTDSPETVSDASYYVCTGTDNGGVHTNSSIPSHAFALLVDGGSGDFGSIAPLGLVKALHLFYRAHTVYLVPTSDFADFADALEASCADFVVAGTPLADPWNGPPQQLAAADCTAVATAIATAELRDEPTFCGFGTILDSDAPPLCPGPTLPAERLYDWESGAEGWTVSRRGIASPEAFHPRDWTLEGDLPDGRPGTAFHAVDAPELSDCYEGLDQTGVLVLESPTLRLPIGSLPLHLAFDHFVATEESYDGANVKLSVEGGPFVPLPNRAYSFNGPIGRLYPASVGNTNPLADEAVWTGTDAGSNTGSWGRSIANLSGLVLPGQEFRLRFELGTDYCFGTGVGWWIDDVRLYSCEGL